MSNRVVITGMGIWSCLGTSVEAVKESLYTGKSGIGIDNGSFSLWLSFWTYWFS